MPPLSKTLRSESPKGYAALEELPESTPAPREPGQVQRANPFIRCPLPPFNATSDTLRQFDENGKIPTRRVIPLPAQIGAGGSTTIVQNTSVSSQSGGSGNVPTTGAKTVTINAPTLLPGDVATITVTVSSFAILAMVGASDLCEIRIYGDANTQSADISRAPDTAVPFEVRSVVTDVILDTLPLQWTWQNRGFVNQDSPQTSNMYVTIVNPTGSAVTPSITITYLPLV